jgi:SRSO17 transposase
LGQPDGIIAFDPSSFPKRGTHSVGVKRQWCGHRGKVDNCQVGVFMGYVSDDEHVFLDFRLSLPQEWSRDEQRRHACHVPPEIRYQTRQEQCVEMLDAWRAHVPHGWAVYLHPAANYHRLTRPTFIGAKRPRRAGSHGLPAAL